ncbi:MAG: MATE family efflux transporter [Butyricicoccus sp.]|nr:MATE family efflux transporter [Butyricicoccus sp.]
MRNKSLLRTVIGIAVPVGLQSMLQSSFAMIDQLMVGQLGSAAVAAVEAAGRPAFIFSVAAGAAAAVAGVMISQYLGMKDGDMADRSLCVNLAAAAALALLFMGLCLAIPGQTVGLFVRDDAAVLALGREYLVRIAWTYLPMGVASVLSVMIRCEGRAAYTLYAGFFSAAVNTALNYVLIFGRFGAPALGVAGAAAASVVSQLVNVLLIAAMFYRVRVRGRRFRLSLALGAEGGRQFARMLLPVLVNEVLWSVGQSVNTFIYGHIGTGALAAMSLTGPVQGLFTGALGGVSQAAGILIGKRLGAREYDEAYREAKAMMRYGLIGSLALSALLIWLRGPYVGLFNVEPEVRSGAAMLLLAFAVLAPVKVANMVLGGGILRSGGKTGYVMVIDMIGTWLAGLPLGLVTAFVLRLPVQWVYFILSQEELVRLGLSFRVFRRGMWIGTLK